MSLIVFCILLLELIIVAILDFHTKKIKNVWSLINIVISVIFFVFLDSHILTMNTLLYPVSIFIIGYILFSLKIMGGGDVKFLSTFFLMIPLKFHENFLYILLLSIISTSVILIILKCLRNYKQVIDAIFKKRIDLILEIIFKKSWNVFAPLICLSWIMFGQGIFID